MEVMAAELYPPPEEDPIPAEAFRTPLAEEIGYAVVGRGTVLLVFGAFLAAVLAAGLALRRSRRPELLGWLGPAAALGAGAAFLVLGEWSRRAVPPTVAVAQIVDAVSGTDEASVRGLQAVYRPDEGPAEVGAGQGGFFQLDMTGAEGRARRLLLTDMGAWHWDNLALPRGVRFAPFRYTVPTAEPLTAVAHFGPEGLEGRLNVGPFQGLADAVLAAPDGRNMALSLGPEAAFRAAGPDVLPPGQFLTGTVLSDRQQRRQQLYRQFLKPPDLNRFEGRFGGRNLVLAWADPLDMHFTLAADARTVGSALLLVPLRLERSAPGTRVTVPGPLIPYHRILKNGLGRPTVESGAAVDMELRFQLPGEVLPLRVERARLFVKIDAPGRRVTVSGKADGEPVEIHRVDSPLDPIRLDVTREALLRLDEQGGLHLNLAVGNLRQGAGDGPGGQRWALRDLELEVTGRTE
jgi:hypothetical protein